MSDYANEGVPFPGDDWWKAFPVLVGDWVLGGNKAKGAGNSASPSRHVDLVLNQADKLCVLLFGYFSRLRDGTERQKPLHVSATFRCIPCCFPLCFRCFALLFFFFWWFTAALHC